ncbi:hypothetical protein LOK49_LG14G00332 [Camellia lanceoleosa]|uniref:Uncharacterized protein n=1 Tax=Camellia lanceoleosa TaxID=1840588 RepID=A0ACC0FAZ5_9ERIC|nr:hypothetical protein LOK49_LG14G00332 [Camellia lanceoleosa]
MTSAQRFYGVVKSYDSEHKKYVVLYDDGDVEVLRLDKERWELVDNGYKPTKIVWEEHLQAGKSRFGSLLSLGHSPGKTDRIHMKGPGEHGEVEVAVSRVVDRSTQPARKRSAPKVHQGPRLRAASFLYSNYSLLGMEGEGRLIERSNFWLMKKFPFAKLLTGVRKKFPFT